MIGEKCVGRLQSGVRRHKKTAARCSSLAAVLLLFVVAPGCASLPLFGKTTKIERADAKNPAAEILALWQASEGPGPNGVPTRGFSGQIFFFTQAKPCPVVVDGKVRIYLFDDRGTVKEQGKPIGEFDFDPVTWNGHAHASTLGPGYSVFIPYPRNDFHQASCSLRIRFIPNAGPTIYSPTASVVLTGPPSKASHTDEMLFSSPQARKQPVRSPAAAPSLTATDAGRPTPDARQNVVPVSGTEDDARLSLADDIAAPAAEERKGSRSGPLRLQGVAADPSQPEDNQ